MTNKFEMFINGRKIEIPFDINEMFSQLGLQEAIPKPQPLIPISNLTRQIIVSKDTAAREAIIDMNKRITKIEEKLNLRKKIPITPVKKAISKTKATPKTKGKSKVKPKVKEKSKVITKKIIKRK